MKHRVYGRHLGRDKNSRNALFKGLVQALFTHGTIETTETRSKSIKGLIDKIINLAKNKNSAYLLKSYISTGIMQNRLIKEIAPKLSDRTSGYVSVVRLGTRMGDQSMLVRMSLIGLEKMEPMKKEVSKSSVVSRQTKSTVSIKKVDSKQEKGEKKSDS